MSGVIAALGLAAGLTALGADGGVVPLAPAAPRRTPSVTAPMAPPLLAPIQGGPTPPDERRYELRRADDGSGDLIYETRKFTARVERDGTVTFQDHTFGISPGWSLFPFAPISTPNARPSLQSALRDWLSRRGPRTKPPPPPPPGAPPPPMVLPRMSEDRPPPAPPPMIIPPMSQYRPDPREACQYPRACYFEPVIVFGPGGTTDLTDHLMRFSGEDPYRRDKALFLAGTRDLRDRMAAHAAAEDVRAAKADLATRMLAIACDAGRSLPARRAVLEALRSELDGTTPAAREAAASVGRFIQAFFDDDDPQARCAAAAPRAP